MENDGVVVHMIYVNLARSLDMLYSLGNIGSEKQAIHETPRGALGQSPEERHSLMLQRREGNLLLFNGPKGVLNILIVS